MIIVAIIRAAEILITAEKARKRWRGTRMHGQFAHNLDEKLVANEQSYRCISYIVVLVTVTHCVHSLKIKKKSYRLQKSGDIMGETVSIIMAVQDQVLSTNNILEE
jgi:hypothetical protein